MDCEELITSEEGLDIIINSAYVNVEQLPIDCYIYVNDRIVNLYLKRDTNPELSVAEYGYAEIPKCYTILEEKENISESIFAEIENKQGLDGEGVMIGFVDTGINYSSPAFRNTDGSSRIKYIWDQTIKGNAPEGYYYGSEYTKEQIDAALKSVNPNELVPTEDTNGHGSYIASIACGSVEGVAGLTGIAPKADIAVVKLKEAKEYLKDFFLIRNASADELPVFQENDIMLGLKYLASVARREGKYLVVCLALGTNIGNYGALPFMSSYIDYLAQGKNFIVVGTGNEANKRHHYYGKVAVGETGEIEIRTNGNTVGFWMEVWGESPDLYSIGITSPGGDSVDKIAYKIGETQEYNFIFEKTKVLVDYLLYGEREDNPLIILRMVSPSDGVWKIHLNEDNILYGDLNVYLPVCEFIEGETYFLESDPYRTLVNPSGVSGCFSISSYDTRTNAIYYASGRGYPLSDIVKPDVAALGVKVLGVSNKNDGSLVAYSGSGVSASITAGSIALFLQWAVVLGNAPEIGNAIVKNFMRRGATRSDNRQYPNREWGYGALNLEEMFALFRYS